MGDGDAKDAGMRPSIIANPKSQIQLVVFDAGGVLVRICHGGWTEVCGRLGIAPPAEFAAEALLPRLTEIGAAFETGRIDEAAFIERVAQVSGFAAEHIVAALDAWLIEPYAGVDAFLECVADTGVTTAVLSNTNATHWRLMTTESHAGIPVHRVHHLFTSFQIGALKPEAAVYEHVERVTGAAPRSILFFDDHRPNIEAARQRGWQAVRIDHDGDPVGQMTEHLVSVGLLNGGDV